MADAGRPLHLVGMAWRNLYRQPLRSSLTVLGVSIGVAAIVSLNVIIQGLWLATEGSIKTNQTDFAVFQAGVAADIFSVLDEEKTRSMLVSDPGVGEVAASLAHVMPLESKPFCLVFGVRRDEYVHRTIVTSQGRTLQADDEVLIGTTAARYLGKRLGDALEVQGESLRIVGVYHSDVIFFEGGVICSLPTLQRLLHKPNQATTFSIRVRPGVDPGAVAHRIEKNQPTLAAISGAHEYSKIDQGLEIVNTAWWAVCGIALVVGSAVVMNTMWMTVHERTREIGVLRALGWSRGGVVRLMLAEAVGIGAGACVVGSLLGTALAHVSTLLSTTQLLLRPAWGGGAYLTAVTIGLLLSVIGGMLPAWRAALVSPVEALRHE